MLDPSVIMVICALISLVCLVLFGIVDFKQWRGISKIEEKVEAFQQQDIGASFGQWLLAKEKEGEPTNLEACAGIVGSKIAQSVSMAARGTLSGVSREFRSVEKAVLEGLQTPETKALLEFVDSIGINRELAGTVAEVLEKRGLLQGIFKNNGGNEGGHTSW